ncbi:hypothetical protein [Geoalkalibacter halelectricus]|uniref:hypothetical protein n=1 Tax=Geoalkalibacter halelectricus TaxID=2847045 RepID=UPI003D224DAD
MIFFARGLVPKFLVLAILLLALGACGKKGPVRPLTVLDPAAPEAFSAEQMGESILLSWLLPTHNQDGSPLTDLAGFRIYRLAFPADDPCPECREEQAVLVAELALDYLPSGSRFGDQLFWFDTRVALESGYLYRILAVNQKDRPGAPARTRLILTEPPPPPAEAAATGHDRLVRLHWSPVTALPQDARLLGYHLYRRTGEAPFSPLPLTQTPLTETAFEDFTVANDQTYGYAVRTVIEHDGRRIFSGRSAEVRVVPRAGR